MSKDLLWPPQGAELLAAELVDAAELEIWNSLRFEHRNATARNKLKLQDRERDIARQLQGTGYIYFGHTVDIQPYFFDAAASGYGLTPTHIKNEPHNWLWDEVMELHSDHPDVSAAMAEYGYNTKHATPVHPHFVGAYVMPKLVLEQCMVRLYERARFARLEGLGFPWTSDPVPEDLLPVSEPQGVRSQPVTY